MLQIFISYRRGDTSGHAGRIYDRLRRDFGDDRLFMDVTGIDAGADFVHAIDQAIAASDVLLLIIGRDWPGRSAAGRRIDAAADFVRIEAAAALRGSVRVVPVLVQDAQLPSADELPEDLKPLTRLFDNWR